MSLKQKYGRLALVAGASKGIGAAFSSYLAASGMDLVLIARKKEDLDQLASSLIDKYRISVTTICCDLSDSEAVNQIKNAVQGMEISLLVYNAALSYIGPFEKNSIGHHNQIAQANMGSPMNLIQFLCEPMLKSGRGAMILMASLAGFQGSGFLSAYAATKAAIEQLTRTFAREMGVRGITANIVSPGPVDTELFRAGKTIQDIERMSAMAALGRLGKVDDIAQVVLFLVSDEARWINGQNIAINGGII